MLAEAQADNVVMMILLEVPCELKTGRRAGREERVVGDRRIGVPSSPNVVIISKPEILRWAKSNASISDKNVKTKYNPTVEKMDGNTKRNSVATADYNSCRYCGRGLMTAKQAGNA